jgi:hypothetical protein
MAMKKVLKKREKKCGHMKVHRKKRKKWTQESP